MARKMVRQDWGNWSLDAYFPMIYNKFYYEGAEWIGRSVQESVQTVNGRAKVYAGLMFGDIKDDFEKALDEAMVMELRAFLFLPVPMKNTFAVLRLIWIKEAL